MTRVPELSNQDIDRWFRHEPRYGGTYSRDLLPRLQTKAYVVNLEPSVDRSGRPLPGSHWTAVINTQPSVVYYYDSFGRPPPVDVLRRMRSTGKRVVSSTVVEQPMHSIHCGLFCCFVIQQMLMGRSWDEVIERELEPGRVSLNDRLVVRDWLQG